MTEEQWSNLTGRAGAVLNFGIEEKEWLKHCKVARLITETPFLAGCEKAEETAFSHLMIYLIASHESGKNIFFHKAADDGDIHTRLFPIGNFLGGDAAIIQCSMDLLALTMLAGYKKDAEDDGNRGKYNPLNAGKWNYELEAEKLKARIMETGTPELEELYTTEDALRGYWRS